MTIIEELQHKIHQLGENAFEMNVEDFQKEVMEIEKFIYEHKDELEEADFDDSYQSAA